MSDGLTLLLLFFFFVVLHALLGTVVNAPKQTPKPEVPPPVDPLADFVVEAKLQDFVVENTVKACPPHKWRYQEVRDPEGKTIRWRIICDLCGPIKPANGPARLV